MSSTAKKAIDLFLNQQNEDEAVLDMGAPEANAYEFQSNGIMQMLDKLQDKFVDERTSKEKQEANSRNAYRMLMQDLKNQIVQAVKDKHSKQLNRASELQSKADEKGDLKQEVTVNKVDEKFLKDLKAMCSMKSSDYESRQKLRASEISAIEKTMEILGGDAVAGNSKKHGASLLQNKATSFGQLRSYYDSKGQHDVGQFLSARAAKLNSRVLAAIALRVSVDPFSKVKKMIKDLVVRLMEEANEEAEHKGWCDTELTTNKQTRKEKSEAVQALTADIDQLKASIAMLGEDIGVLSKAVADLDNGMAKATKLRAQEKGENGATISDCSDAQTAVAQAMTVLREFYAKAGDSTALLEIEPYKGMQSETGGVIGFLEVIESDFARLESETAASEATGQKEYDEFMTDSKVDKASKSTGAAHKAAKKQGEAQTLTSKQNDLAGTQKELDAALTYFDKLRPSCVDSGVSYEDRVNRRKEEIESLQEALKVMNGEDLA